MGCCASSNTENVSKEVSDNREEKKNSSGGSSKQKSLSKLQNDDVKKLLFLGPGGCGKSTLFKQLRQIFGETMTDEERIGYQDHIWSFIIETIQKILSFIDDPSELSSDEARKAYKEILDLNPKNPIDAQVAAQIKLLWKEPTFKELFEEEAQVTLVHSCAHFLDDIERISSPNYIPTDLDILLQRRPTTGLVEQAICINNTWFQVFDVGGQRNERRKWIHQFENVSAVVFVASLSSFDEQMYDDETTNSMEDSMQLFEEICDSPYFVHQHMILLLNKQDLLKEKVTAGKNLKDYPATKDYNGENTDPQSCIKHVEAKFRTAFERSVERFYKSPEHTEAAKKRLLFVRIICAYELATVKSVFIDVQGILTGRITSN